MSNSTAADWKCLIGDTLGVQSLTGRDSYGKPTYGGATNFDCRVVFQDELIRDLEGQEKLARGHIWIQGNPTLSPEDQVTLSDTTTPPILKVDRIQDETSTVHHVKAFFGG